jgi:hypothetical protein
MKARNKSDEAQMWVVVICCCIVQLLVAADWVGLI